MATPLEISIAIHYHCRPDDYGRHNGDNNFEAPAVQSALIGFTGAGLLKFSSDAVPSYSATPGLRVYVDALCHVPAPEQQWIIPSANR